MTQIETNDNCITCWPNLEPIGQILNLYKWNHIQLAKFGTNAMAFHFNSWRDNSSYRLYTLGPLCLWQCFKSKPGTIRKEIHFFANYTRLSHLFSFALVVWVLFNHKSNLNRHCPEQTFSILKNATFGQSQPQKRAF